MQKAAALYDAGDDMGAGEYANMAKYAAGEVACNATDVAVHTHGGNGLAQDRPAAGRERHRSDRPLLRLAQHVSDPSDGVDQSRVDIVDLATQVADSSPPHLPSPPKSYCQTWSRIWAFDTTRSWLSRR